jgi:hypothetical protein
VPPTGDLSPVPKKRKEQNRKKSSKKKLEESVMGKRRS